VRQSDVSDWVLGVVLVYGCLFGIGKVVFGEWGWGLALLTLAGVCGYLIFWDLSRRGWQTLSGSVAAERVRSSAGD